jgi:hypothetical protein
MAAEQKDSWLRKGNFPPDKDTVVANIAERDAIIYYNSLYPELFGLAYGGMLVATKDPDTTWRLNQAKDTWTDIFSGTSSAALYDNNRLVYGGEFVKNESNPNQFILEATKWWIWGDTINEWTLPDDSTFSVISTSASGLYRYVQPILKQDGTLQALSGIEAVNPHPPTVDYALSIALPLILVGFDTTEIIYKNNFYALRSDSRKPITGKWIENAIIELYARPLPTPQLIKSFIDDNYPFRLELYFDDASASYRLRPHIEDYDIAGGGGTVSPLTTKGDLYVFSTVNDRLGVGADGSLLIADPSADTGLKWDTPTNLGFVVNNANNTTTSAFSLTSNFANVAYEINNGVSAANGPTLKASNSSNLTSGIVTLYDNGFMLGSSGPLPVSGTYNTQISSIAGTKRLLISSSELLFQGAVYNADYSANFVNRSLITKEYVDTKVSTSLGASFIDNVFRISDEVDNTKKFGFEVSGVAAGATRIVTISNFDGTMAYLDSPIFTTKITTPIIYGSSATSGNLTIGSTSSTTTKGNILFGTSIYNEANNWLGINATPDARLTIKNAVANDYLTTVSLVNIYNGTSLLSTINNFGISSWNLYDSGNTNVGKLGFGVTEATLYSKSGSASTGAAFLVENSVGTMLIRANNAGVIEANKVIAATTFAGGSLSLNLSTADVFRVTLTGNISAFDVTNLVAGRIYKVYFIQDATGFRTITGLAAKFKTEDARTILLSTQPNAVDMLQLEVEDANVSTPIVGVYPIYNRS